MAQLHVMHILFSLCTGGLERQVVNVINHSDRERFRHSICCLETIGPLAEALREPKPEIHLTLKKPGISFSLPLRLARLFLREKVDVAHTGSFGPYLYSVPAAKLTRTAVIYGDHGDLPVIRSKRRIRWAAQILYPFSDAVYAVTEAGRQCLAELTGRPAERIEMVPNGVDTDRFAPGDPAAARERIGVDPKAFVVGFVGRIAPVKNLGALFDVLPAVDAAVENLVVVIVGDGPDMDKVRRLAAESPVAGRIRLLGDRSDVHELLPAMSVVVLPSLSEAHSVALLEAMAAGCPVVASRVGGNPEIVREGETGFLFSLDRPRELGEHIVFLGRSEGVRRRLGENARNVVLREFSMETTVKRHEAMYDRAARRRKK